MEDDKRINTIKEMIQSDDKNTALLGSILLDNDDLSDEDKKKCIEKFRDDFLNNNDINVEEDKEFINNILLINSKLNKNIIKNRINEL